MARYTIFALLVLTICCNTKLDTKEVKPEIFKSYDYRISITIWNGFYGFNNQYVLDNLQNDIDYSSKPMTLQYIVHRQKQDRRNEKIRQFIPSDTTKIDISKQSCDTLFDLTRNFFKTFGFNNCDTVGHSKPIITDDSHSTIELSYGGRTLIARISSINNPTIATSQFDSLINFLQKYKPAKE
jgi:hypothetical protein